MSGEEESQAIERNVLKHSDERLELMMGGMLSTLSSLS